MKERRSSCSLSVWDQWVEVEETVVWFVLRLLLFWGGGGSAEKQRKVRAFSRLVLYENCRGRKSLHSRMGCVQCMCLAKEQQCGCVRSEGRADRRIKLKIAAVGHRPMGAARQRQSCPCARFVIGQAPSTLPFPSAIRPHMANPPLRYTRIRRSSRKKETEKSVLLIGSLVLILNAKKSNRVGEPKKFIQLLQRTITNHPWDSRIIRYLARFR